MAADIKISIIQTDIIWESKSQNFAKYESYIIDNQLNNTLVVLPEMFATGFSMNVKTLSEDMNGETITWMKQIATKYDIALCGSFIAIENNRFYNRLAFVTSDGNIQYYDKRHLFRMGEENEHYSSGKSNLIVNYNGWKIKPLICYDLRFPVWSRNNYINGESEYDCLIYIANWPQARSHAWKSLLVARAIENQCYVIGVNRVGLDGKNLQYSGDSALINPQGTIISNIKPFNGSVESIELKYKDLSDYRASFPVGKDADNFKIE